MITSASFHLLHEFEQLVNLINEKDHILSVHTAEVWMGPFSMQVSKETFSELKETNKLKGWKPPAHELFGFMHGESITMWQARPNWETFSADTSTQLNSELRSDIQQAMDGLHQAVINNNQEQICLATHKLVGRGNGLTPTGDDVLIGTMHGLHVLGWDQAIIEMIGQSTIGRTTSLSGQFVQAAVVGEATEPWHQLLAGDANALENILSVGATSGKDAWIGFVGMIRAAESTSA
ncbi:MAG: DUF2877 domain-containing protein [Chloroflexota bacterium]